MRKKIAIILASLLFLEFCNIKNNNAPTCLLGNAILENIRTGSPIFSSIPSVREMNPVLRDSLIVLIDVHHICLISIIGIQIGPDECEDFLKMDNLKLNELDMFLRRSLPDFSFRFVQNRLDDNFNSWKEKVLFNNLAHALIVIQSIGKPSEENGNNYIVKCQIYGQGDNTWLSTTHHNKEMSECDLVN